MIVDYHNIYIPLASDSMESKDADQSVHAQLETTNNMKSLDSNENNKTMGPPSPPSSVKATESDNGRNENGSHLGEVAGGKLPVSGSSASGHRGANAGRNVTTTLERLPADRWTR